MNDHQMDDYPRDHHIVYTPRKEVVTPRAPYVHPAPRKPPPSLTTLYTQLFMKHLKQEYWSYIALLGLTSLYTGIMIAVFGFTDILASTGGQVEWFGIFLILTGVALILTSGILYHRKERRLRPCICCGIDMDDTPELPVRNKKRLRFAPNLISPYYEIAKQQQAEREASMLVTTSPVEELHQEPEMMEAEEQRAENSEGSSTALITKQTNGTKVTLC